MTGDHAEEPPDTGEVDAMLHVVVVSTRLTVTGEDPGGDVRVARDVVELLVALEEERRTVVLFDARAPSLDLDRFGRIARDFRREVAILVRGGGDEARTKLFACGVYRARCYEPSPRAACDQTEGSVVLEASAVLDPVRRHLMNPVTIPAGGLG